MPTISFSYKDFEKLLGRKIPMDEFKDLVLLYAKAEVEDYDSKTAEIKLALDDTNLPYLWSVEGLARYFKGVFETEKGLTKFKVSSSKYDVIVDKSVEKVRPYIATFVASGKIDNYLLEQLIQFQEKFCEGYGRKRQKVSIGLYSSKKVKFPVHYKAAAPDSIKFVPLEMDKKILLSKVLELHPKGKQYGWIIKDFSAYPILVDSNNEVLSLVPIINSNFTGKLVVGDSELLFEATGTDEEAVNLAANIFAQNLYERGFKLQSITVHYNNKKVKSPHSFNEKIKIRQADVEVLTGLKLTHAQTKDLLERARYGVSDYTVSIPDYRKDILHVFDVIEDIAIMYGFNNIESAPLTNYTMGSPTKMNEFVDSVREIVLGLGFQEILSPILSNKAIIEEKMEVQDRGIVEISNPMSETYSAVRSWLTPIMMEVLSKNKHRDFPQKIFEQGLINVRKGQKIEDKEAIVLAISQTKTDFTEIKQCLDAIMNSLGVVSSVEPFDMGTFIKGRGGSIKVNGKAIGLIGEISPKVLSNWELEMPVTALEIDLSELKRIIS
ncbi:phenylalanine--tRNA ligase subunit beta [Candidatus Woesearchaeota archaeon]|nr:phenylalanine--tRNA ligase subunit beta [Candidatus Woesearchaeota archaeon]|tara:strand:- start:23586 stop:25238 length:1653 start_codon:yes stop_codon:yes gene_type:complete